MKTLHEVLAEYERRRQHAERTGATAPMAAVYDVVIEELEKLQGDTPDDLSTSEVAELLGMNPQTVARKAAEGIFQGAWKTSGVSGDWRIPRAAVSAYRRGEPGATPVERGSQPWEV